MTRDFRIVYRLADGRVESFVATAATEAAAMDLARAAVCEGAEVVSATELEGLDWNAEMFNREEAARFLRCEPRTLYDYQANGWLPPVILYRRAELLKAALEIRTQRSRLRAGVDARRAA